MRRLCAAVLLLLCLSVCAHADAPLTAKGVVVDTEGKPISGIKVYAVLSWGDDRALYGFSIHSAVKASTVAGKDGSFAFTGLPIPKRNMGYCFVAYTPGRRLGWLAPRGAFQASNDWSTGPAPASLRLVVGRTISRSGRVTDASGAGAAGVRVRACSMVMPNGQAGVEAERIAAVVRPPVAVTDKDGDYTLRGVPEGARILAGLSGPGWATRRIGGEIGSRLTVVPGGSVHGRVVGDGGKGLAGIEVYLTTLGIDPCVTRTGTDGAFSFQGIPAGECNVGAYSVGIAVRRIPTVKVVAGGAARAADIVAAKGVAISGVVIDADSGRPIGDVVVLARDDASARPSWNSRSAATGADGRFTLSAIPGKAVLWYYYGKRGYAARDRDGLKVTVPSSGMTGVRVKMTRLHVCRGSVVDVNGKPVVGARVVLHQGEDPRAAGGSTDSRGRFAFPYGTPEQPGGG